MSWQTFKAQIAIGSWANTPFMPNLDIPTTIVADAMSRDKKDKGKGKAIEVSD